LAQAWDLPAPEAGFQDRPNAAGLDLSALKALLASMGEPAWRGAQVFEGLYRHRWTSWEAFTSLSKGLRARLADTADLDWPEVIQSHPSEDASTKHVFQLRDGKQVEGVHMPYANRTTLCLSSQVGCAMGCTFCATGQMGIVRNLTSAEIVGQVVAMLNHHGHPHEQPVNLVFMGMGEPLHNLDHLMAAFDLLSDPEGLAIPPRRITVSTSGLVAGIDRLGTFLKRPRLALSLNATTNEHRSRIMPVNRVWNLEALAEALARFPLQASERITLEYVLLRGVTDSLEDGRRLTAFARRFPSKVNLIPFNPHEGSGFEPPEESRVGALCRLLAEAGLTVSVRRSRGQDVAGACGQLVRQGRPPKGRV
jgi:23S rRNA (adenine2503-C2)-methyltransferase